MENTTFSLNTGESPTCLVVRSFLLYKYRYLFIHLSVLPTHSHSFEQENVRKINHPFFCHSIGAGPRGA
jgi:hypothetical protein